MGLVQFVRGLNIIKRAERERIYSLLQAGTLAFTLLLDLDSNWSYIIGSPGTSACQLQIMEFLPPKLHEPISYNKACMWIYIYLYGISICIWVSLGGSNGKEYTSNAGDLGSIPRLGRAPGEGNGYSLQYSCLENPMDRGAWRATVHGVTKSWMQLSNSFTLIYTYL